MTAEIDLALERDDLLCDSNFIAGEWVPAADSARFPVFDPATAETVGQVASSGCDDARKALGAAQAAFPAWAALTARERARFLKRWHALVLEHTEDLARIMALEQGKIMNEARGEVAYGASYIEWFAEEAVRSRGEILPSLIAGRKQMVVKEPIGVVAAVTPWNFPLAMIARKLAPALAAGCTVVTKPAEDTPLTALALIKLAQEAGLPPGVVNMVTAPRESAAEVVDEWLHAVAVRKITFTGSTPVGKHLARGSADTLKKLSLELGGNAPFIVFEDADLDAAARGLIAGKFRNGGQACVSPNRIYVHSAVYDDFVARLLPLVKALRVGSPRYADSDLGPMINERAIEKIDRHVQDALSLGAEALTGGASVRDERADGPYYYAPTVLSNANREMAVFREETFGPVIPLFRFDSEEEVLDQANDTPFGLAAYFYTENASRIWRVSSRLGSGIVGINASVLASEAAPFGGMKESGYGREGAHQGLEEFMQLKYLCQGELA